MDRAALAAWLAQYGAAPFHAGQVFRWLYRRHVLSPAAWTDLPTPLRKRLTSDATVAAGSLAARTEAADGTIKYRVAFRDGRAVEAVHLVHEGRVTLCLSSQVGCALACDFCLTGRMGLVRHLSAGEIAGQAALIRADRDLGEQRFHVVFMGMGEPLHNYDAVLAAFRLLTDSDGFALSRKRITVSTAGLAPAIERLAGEPERPRLAVSLNATTDALRDRLMPINRRYPLRRLLVAVRRFAETTGERFTFEYVLLRGINDADHDADRLVRYVHALPAKVNLIPFNPVPGRLAYEPPERTRVHRFRDRLLRRGVPTSVRWSRGAGARAACGQLAVATDGTGRRSPLCGRGPGQR